MSLPLNTDLDNSAPQLVAEVHHAWITGLVLTLVARKDAATAEEFVFRLFRRQHLERFLPGIKKFGLSGLPHPIAAARYHYFSNQLGGVKVEYLEESVRKAWIRYPPPRWMWEGTAICGVPSEVNRAMLGPEQARFLVRLCALQIGMHSFDRCAAALAITDDSAAAFLTLVARLLEASGDTITLSDNGVLQTNWRVFRDVDLHPVVREQWLALFEGMLGVHNRFLRLDAQQTPAGFRITVE